MSGRRYPSTPAQRDLADRPRRPPSSSTRRAARVATVDLPATKPRTKRTATIADRVAEASREAIVALAAGRFSSSYDGLRAATLRGFAMAFARAYGMQADVIDGHLGTLEPEPRRAFVAAVRSLPYDELEPEHWGHVHESLTGWRLDDVGAIVPSSERRGGGVHFTPRELTRPIVAKTLEPLLAVVPPERTLELRVCDPSVGAGAFLLELVRQLGARLVDAGIESDPLVAKRLVAIHCAYGVDVSPWAVASAKIALWLECRADGMPAGWLDHNLRVGDALVGLSADQMARFHWSPTDLDGKGRPIPEVPELRRLVDASMTLGAERRRLEMQCLSLAARSA